jgi:CubicO group peptidase (beta-lactamase class C family)
MPLSPHASTPNQRRTGAALVTVIDDLVASGVVVGAQVAARHDDGAVVTVAAGVTADGGPLTPTTRMPLFCLSKTVTALTVLDICREQGIPPDTPVADALPDFGRNGKKHVTLYHLLTNTGGLDETGLVGCRDGATPRDRHQQTCWAPIRPGWDPASDARYDYESAFTALGFWIEAVTGTPYADGITARFGGSFGTLGFLADLDGRPRPAEIDRAPWTPHVWMPSGRAWQHSYWSAISGSPAGGAVGTADDVCRLWQQVAGAAAGLPGVVDAGVARQMVTPCRGRRFDQQLSRFCDYGLGVMTGLDDYRSWGLPAELTSGAYGHLGLGVAFAGYHPDHAIAFAILLNGASTKPVEFSAQRALFTALARGVDEEVGTR